MLSRVITSTVARRVVAGTAARAASAASIPSHVTFHRHITCACNSCGLSSQQKRSMTTVEEVVGATADDAMKFSGFKSIDFTIKEDATVYDAVQKFAAFNIGALVVTDAAGNMTGVISERDYITKIALLGRTSKETKVKEIATSSSRVTTAKAGESVESCMEKMMSKGIRHLPIVSDKGDVIGMISIKDLVKTVVGDKDKTIKVLSDFALGKGGHFGSE